MNTLYICGNISLIFFIMRNISHKSRRENQNKHFMFNKFFFSESRTVYETAWKTIVERGRPQMNKDACALLAGYLRLQIHTHNIQYVIILMFRYT